MALEFRSRRESAAQLPENEVLFDGINNQFIDLILVTFYVKHE